MKKTVVLFSLLLSSFASANSSHPQFFYQAESGQFALTPSIGVARTEVEFKNSFTTQTFTSSSIDLDFEYGFSESLALEISQGYSSSKIEVGTTDISYSGATDLETTLKGNYQMDALTLRYGLNLGLGFTAKEDGNGNTDNQYTGRNDLTPYIGFDYRINNSVFGGQFSQEFLLGKQVTEDANGVETKSKGGNSSSVSAFYEHYFEKVRVGGALQYSTTSDIKLDGGGTLESVDLFGLAVYGVFYVSDSFTIVPSLVSAVGLDDEVNGAQLERYTGVATNVDFRLTF